MANKNQVNGSACAENLRRIRYIEQCFGATGIPLCQVGRVLIGEGILTKICRKKPKLRQFYLFNDILVYGNIIIAKRKFNQQHIIELEDVVVTKAEESGDLKYGFIIQSPKKSFTVYTSVKVEQDEWMLQIQKYAAESRAQIAAKGEKKLNDPSPVWIPDAEATVCMHCKQSVFSVINRRHHCRKCGIVACNSCTSKRWMLPNQSSKPLRICLTCYSKLYSSAQSNSTPGLMSGNLGDSQNRSTGTLPGKSTLVDNNTPIFNSSQIISRDDDEESSSDEDSDDGNNADWRAALPTDSSKSNSYPEEKK